MFNPKFRNIVIEPKKFFKDLFQVISWTKLISFILVIIFFANVGIFIYDKKHPTNLSEYDVNKIESPYGNDKDSVQISSPSKLFGVTTSFNKGDSTASNPDTSAVFEQKVKGDGTNLIPVPRANIVTTDTSESIEAGDTIFLSALESYDPDGYIKEYRWDYDESNGLGIDGEGVNTTVKYNNAGLYTITLITIDEKGAEASTTLSVTVAEKQEEQSNDIIQGLSSNQIDFNSLNFTSRSEIQNSVQGAYAEFQSNATSTMAQAIYSSTQAKLPSLPSLSDIELSVGNDPSNTPPTIDTVNPKDGNTVYELRPIISAGFYGNNEIDTNTIEVSVDGESVTPLVTKNKFGIQYRPEEDLGYGQHNVMLVVGDINGLKTTKSWHFTIIDPKAENDTLAPKYEDKEGPEIIMHYPDENAKEVKPDSDIRLTYAEPVKADTVEVAVVDLSTNITKFFTGNQIEWNSTKTGFVISGNENIFDYDRAYQIVVRQEDELGNKSNYEWFILGESYDAPEFKITSPNSDSNSNKPQITVTGYADPTYTVTVGDKIAMVDTNGAFKADINLNMGKNEILVVAKDLKGKESSQYLVVTYDPESNGADPIIAPQDSPVIMDSTIRDGQVIDQVRPQISFVFADTDGVDTKSVKLKLDNEDVTTYSFIARDSITYKPLKDLEQGQHSLELVVADKTGKTTDYKMNFTIDAYPENPTNLTASLVNDNKSVLLLWNGVSNIENPEYRVYRSTTPNVPITAGSEVMRGITTTSWTDNDVIDNTTYYYVVTAVSKNENIGKPSNEIKIRVDSVAPSLKISEPTKNFITELDKVTMKGVTEKDATVEVFVNFVKVGEPKINTDGTFEINLDLIPGDNIITTVAKDTDGNESVDVRTVTYNVPDTEAPTVEDKNPMGTEVTVASNIVITYNEPMDVNSFNLFLKEKDSTDSIKPISLNNIELQVSKDKKTFTYNPAIDLKYVTNYVVKIEAKDLAGNESIGDDWEFKTGDKNAPKLEVVTPEVNFNTPNESINVSGTTEPNINVAISINGVLKVPSLTSQANGYFTQLVQLDPGHNVISVVATDHLNHASMVIVQGFYDAPDLEKPLLTIYTPQQNAVINSSITSTSGYTEPGASVSIAVNGKDQGEVAVNDDGSFNHELTLYSGTNLITYTSSDDSGNVNTIGRTIIFDNIGPSLGVTNPIDGLTTNQNSLELRGTTDKVDSVITVTVRGSSNNSEMNVNVLADGTFNQFINLDEGNNYIVVKATDNNGNETIITRSVYYDPVGGVWNTLSQSVNGQSTENQIVSSQSTENQISNIFSKYSLSNNYLSFNNVSGQSTTDVIDPSTGQQRYTGGDVSAPNLTITPENGTKTNETTVEVGGTTEPEANIEVYQNGIFVYDGQASVSTAVNENGDLVEAGSFSRSVGLNEGINAFIVNSIDASGNKTAGASVVTLDTTGANINVLNPKDNQIIKDDTVIVYGVTEPNIDVEVTLASTQKVKSDEYGYFTAEVQTGSNGQKNIVVTATDELGNKSKNYTSVTIDKTSPTLSLDNVNGVNLDGATSSPYGPIVYIRSTFGTIEGYTEDNSVIEVRSNGRLVGNTKSDDNGYFTANVTTESGSVSNITVSSSDIAGNEKSKYFRLKGDYEAPVVQIYSPTISSNLADGTINLSGIVKDESPTVTLRMYKNGSMSASATDTVGSTMGSFSTVISGLQEGPNIIKIVATDSLGNEKVETISYMYYPKAENAPSTPTNPGKEKASESLSDLGEAYDNSTSYVSSNYEQGVFGAYGVVIRPTVNPIGVARDATGWLNDVASWHSTLAPKGFGGYAEGTLMDAMSIPNLGELLAGFGSFGASDEDIQSTTKNLGEKSGSVSIWKTVQSTDTPVSTNSTNLIFSKSGSSVECSVTTSDGITSSGVTANSSGSSWVVSLSTPRVSIASPIATRENTSGETEYLYAGTFTVGCTEY